MACAMGCILAPLRGSQHIRRMEGRSCDDRHIARGFLLIRAGQPTAPRGKRLARRNSVNNLLQSFPTPWYKK
jgi:hypothetical protein